MMAERVADWFPRFVEEHRSRHPDAFLPEYDTEEGRAIYDAWREVLVRRGIHDFAVATEASKLLAGEVLKHPREHFPTLVTIALGVYKQRQAQATGGPAGASPIESAAIASKGCLICGGGGLVTVWNPGLPGVDSRLKALAAYCDDCPMGRHIEENHRAKAPDVRRRSEWRSVLMRRGWLAHPVGLDDAHVDAHRHFSPAELIRDWTAPRQPPPSDASS
jgi:hypothetical protein